MRMGSNCLQIEQQIRSQGTDLDRGAKEVDLIDLFRRRDHQSARNSARPLDLDRSRDRRSFQCHQAADRSMTHEEVDADVRSIDALFATPLA